MRFAAFESSRNLKVLRFERLKSGILQLRWVRMPCLVAESCENQRDGLGAGRNVAVAGYRSPNG